LLSVALLKPQILIQKNEPWRETMKNVRSVFLSLLIVIFQSTGMDVSAQSFWERTYGAAGYDAATSMQTTSDGGFIVAALTDSFGAGSYDLLILKLDSSGNIQWERTYGGSGSDFGISIHTTSDGGYIVAGFTDSFGADLHDFWILKLDSSGNIQWQKTYGGIGNDRATSIQPTHDGGYIVAGGTDSFGAGLRDFWILKLDSSGNIQWQKTYGGTGNDRATSIQMAADNGFIVAGETDSFGAGLNDYWILKLDSSGNLQWQKTYGGNVADTAHSIQPTSDGGYIVAGETVSFGAGGPDFWILKLDSSGDIQWQKTYGGGGEDVAFSIQTSSDGGYVVAGATESLPGDYDFWILKLDPSGNIQWQKIYGETAFEEAVSVQQISNGRILVAGQSLSYGSGSGDVWILRMNSNGEIDPSCVVFDTFAVPAMTSVSPGGGAFFSAEPAVTISTPIVDVSDTKATVIEQCASSCLFCDDFEDGVLDPNWTYEKPAWTESGGFLSGTPVKKKAIAVASPAFAGCIECEMEVSVKTAGGPFNKVWIYMHRTDKRTLTELLIKEENDKVILKQRIDKVVVAKNKATVRIDPNTEYVFQIAFDGTQYTVFMNGTLLFSMNPGGLVPNATVGFAAKSTTASFGDISIN
jgi:uncharacterized delta-60 repeat protein